MIDLSKEALQYVYNRGGFAAGRADYAARLMMDATEESRRPRCPECHSADGVEVRHVIYEYGDVLGPRDGEPYKLLVMAADDQQKRYCDKQPEDGQPEWVFVHVGCDAEWEIEPDIELEWL